MVILVILIMGIGSSKKFMISKIIYIFIGEKEKKN